jgi:uncharacterized membrane protein YfcA
MSTNSANYEYQKRKLILWGTLLTLIPALLIIGPLGRRFGVAMLPAIVAVVWFIAAMTAAIYRTTWKCPRCRKPFFRRVLYHAAFTTKCVHCGLEPAKFEAANAEADPLLIK